MSDSKAQIFSLEAFYTAIAESVSRAKGTVDLKSAMRQARKISFMAGQAQSGINPDQTDQSPHSRSAAAVKTKSPEQRKDTRFIVIDGNIDKAASDHTFSRRPTTKELPAVQLIEIDNGKNKNGQPSSAPTPTFGLVDYDPKSENWVKQCRKRTEKELKNLVIIEKKTEDGKTDDLSDYTDRNPGINELLRFWAKTCFLNAEQIRPFAFSLDPYFRNIPVSRQQMRKLYDILEDDQATKKLLENERHYWESLTKKERKPWKKLYTQGFHPLFASEEEFPPNVVEAMLILLSVFRQAYPKQAPSRWQKIRQKLAGKKGKTKKHPIQ